MIFRGEATQIMPESVQREVVVTLQAESALEAQAERRITDHLIKTGIILPGAPREAYESAKLRLDPETIARITSNTKELFYDLFVKMAEQQYELDALKHKNTLTGLANRKMANKTFELLREQLKNEEEQNPMAVVNLDLDGFKIINDTYGHDVGNEVLKFVGKKLKTIRATDLAVHFSGDEFGLILSNLKPAKGQTLSETVEIIIAKIISSIEQTKELVFNNGNAIPLSLSASAGFKIVQPENSDDFFTVNEEADSASKLAKKCKGINTLKAGSTRIVDADKTKEEFLKEKGVSLDDYERSEEAGDFKRPATDLLSRITKQKNISVTPEMVASADEIMQRAAQDIKKLL